MREDAACGISRAYAIRAKTRSDERLYLTVRHFLLRDANGLVSIAGTVELAAFESPRTRIFVRAAVVGLVKCWPLFYVVALAEAFTHRLPFLHAYLHHLIAAGQ